MTDRDHFAAAALAGLLAQGDDGSFSEESYARSAYRWADAMLSVRDSRTADTKNHDAAPAATAVSTDDRTDKAAPSQCRDRPGDTPALNDAEREAVEYVVRHGRSQPGSTDTLRGLLERLGAANSGDNRRSVGGERARSGASHD